ncbi:alpha/beta fold hydrolase [Streptomyces griseoruber]|uniref:alpha/beta fold hydrolase n=1 Tax=Streptomyces griseoruber TaxID=1943 RepID=UPI0037A36126
MQPVPHGPADPTGPSGRAVVGGAAPAALATTGVPQGAAFASAAGEPSGPWEPVPAPARVPVTEYQVPVSGGGSPWCWDTGGDGEAIVLLHPCPGSGESRPYQQPGPAGAGFWVIGYSRRGAHRSVAGTRAEADTASGDLDTLADRLGLDRFPLSGSAASRCRAVSWASRTPRTRS